MTDIVERLEAAMGKEQEVYLYSFEAMRDAKAEVERLRAAYDASYSEADINLHAERVTKELRADNERLRAISVELCGAMDDCITWLSSEFAPQSQSRALERAAKAKAAFRALEPKP